MPVPPVTPQVEAYDELTYRCKQGDTFQSISSTYYQSDKFAKALLTFNRSHPRVSDGIRQEPPVLQTGDMVFIPPQRILERKYASSIPDHVPLPPVQVTAAAPVAPPAAAPLAPPASAPLAPPASAPLAPAASTPPPFAPAASAPPASPPVGLAAPRAPGAITAPFAPTSTVQPPAGNSWATPTGEKQYRVRRNGEMIRDIAGRTLNNRDRWIEIYKLNMRFNPEYPVHEGTVLRLPNDARVDPADRP